MTQKQKNIKMHLFYCLMQLLLECLDELKVTNPRMIELKNNMSEFCELLLPNAEIRFVKGRIAFKGINTKGEYSTKNKGKHDSMIVILRGRVYNEC